MVFLPGMFGPSGFLSSFFLKPENILVALALIIPLILLYLIRPKPKNVAIPSLMFVMKDLGRSHIRRFFHTIFRDILLLLQVLIILLIGAALAKPFINVSQESLVHQAIVVVDVSASARAFNDARFDEIISSAKDSLSSENVIIVARTSPVALEVSGDPKLSASRAKGLLNDLTPTDMDGDLPSALDLAAQYVGPQTKVTIISDFVLSRAESKELIEAKIKVLRSKGAIVEVKTIGKPGKNIGIVDAAVSAQNATVALKIQNFNSGPEEFSLEYNGDKISLPKNILAKYGDPGSLIVVNVPLVHGKSEIRLKPDDDFMTDNHYYISLPDESAINILLISNDPAVEQSRLIPAIKAAGDQFTTVNIEYAAPPKIPDLNHRVYILKDINTDFILPGVIRDLQEKVSNGAVLVVYGQPNLFAVNFQGILPVAPKDIPPLGGRQEILVNSSLGLFRGIQDVGQVDGSQLQRVRLAEDSVMQAYVQTNDGLEPVIAHKRIGKGVVIYYGIKDQKAADIDTNAYVILWGRIIDYSIPDVRAINIATGNVLNVPGKTISTPFGKHASPVMASQSGFYYTPLAIAANLYSLRMDGTQDTKDISINYESAINDPAIILTGDGILASSTKEEVKLPYELTTIIIILAGVLLLFELLYIKLRGDL